MSNLANLTGLWIDNNLLSGSIPTEFVQLTQLQVLSYENNDLCEPQDEVFQNWLESLPYSVRTGFPCANQENVTVWLMGSDGLGISGGSVQYYDQGWKSISGSTDETGKLLTNIPATSGIMKFRMNYVGGTTTITQDVSIQSSLAFSTVNVTAVLFDHEGSELDTGTVLYYAGGWREFGATDIGRVSIELLPGTYTFRMKYAGGTADIKQDIAVDPQVNFRTIKANVFLTDHLEDPT